MKNLILVIIAISFFSMTANAEQYENLFDREVTVGGVELTRKGVSPLTVGYIFKVHVAAFYQPKESGPSDVLADQPRRIVIEYLRDIAREDYISAGEDMMARHHSKEEIEAIREGINQINALYQDVKKGDRYSITYLPGVGTTLQFNDEVKGTIPGAEFARVYFSIWLGDKTPYKDFRDRLVGLN
jgi:Chalcone isomerase-like